MLRPNNNKARDSKTLVRQILKLSADIFQAIKLRIPPEWLMSDMTVAQLRVLLFLYTDGQSRLHCYRYHRQFGEERTNHSQRGCRGPSCGDLRIVSSRPENNEPDLGAGTVTNGKTLARFIPAATRKGQRSCGISVDQRAIPGRSL